MSHVEVRFGMRIKEHASLEDLATRLGKVLRCTFVLSDDPRDAWDTMVTEVLFLRLMITYWPHDEPRVEGKEYMYTLTGVSIEAKPWESTSKISLTEWILAKLRLHDSPAWSIPTIEELRAEVTAKDPFSEP
jgi:hypothetical protein